MNRKQAKPKQATSVGKAPHQQNLKPLSMNPLSMDEALKAFMEVDPQKVDERLEKEGIGKAPKTK